MRIFSLISVCLLVCFFQPKNSDAQSLNTLFGNTALGAANGAILGSATMALSNSTNIRPLTFGVGAGTLFGLGVGAYDMYQLTPGTHVNGLFHNTPISGGIIILDTIYGAGAGALIGMAISLMGDTPVVYGLQYGGGTGAWVGFAFGLVDAFYLSRPGGDVFEYEQFGAMPGQYQPASGFFTLLDNENSSIALLNPVLIENTVSGPNGSYISDSGFAVEMIRWHVRF